MDTDNSSDRQLVLVTGATGYLASCLVKQLADSGEYRLRCTVRSLENNKKLDTLKEILKDSKEQPEFFEANLLDGDDCWMRLVRGCDYVLHTASPFPLRIPRDPEEVLTPAVEGTLSVLRACANSGSVKRVVITSSCAAIGGEVTATKNPLTEETWPEVQAIKSPYIKSKAVAEKAAWEYVKGLPESRRFELTTINPGLIVGPPVIADKGVSIAVCKNLLTGRWPMLPRTSMPCVDVRDVVDAHVAALKHREAAGQRFILTNGTLWMKEIAKTLAEEFNPRGYKVTKTEAPSFLIHIQALWNLEARAMKRLLNSHVLFDNTKAKTVLNMNPRPVKEALIDMGNALINLGIVPQRISRC